VQAQQRLPGSPGYWDIFPIEAAFLVYPCRHRLLARNRTRGRRWTRGLNSVLVGAQSTTPVQTTISGLRPAGTPHLRQRPATPPPSMPVRLRAPRVRPVQDRTATGPVPKLSRKTTWRPGSGLTPTRVAHRGTGRLGATGRSRAELTRPRPAPFPRVRLGQPGRAEHPVPPDPAPRRLLDPPRPRLLDPIRPLGRPGLAAGPAVGERTEGSRCRCSPGSSWPESRWWARSSA
jgi:hypothetical protein